MKINDKKELHLKTADELQKLIKDGNEIVTQLRLDNVQNRLKNTRSLFNTRQTIAIMKSILKTKEVKNA